MRCMQPLGIGGKLTLISLGDKFKKALAVLLEKLNSCRASFVRCVKPNSLMKSKVFTAEMILAQLQCAGMLTCWWRCVCVCVYLPSLACV